jgi:hypothetical protein
MRQRKKKKSKTDDTLRKNQSQTTLSIPWSMSRSDANLPVLPDSAPASTQGSRFQHSFSSIPVLSPDKTFEQTDTGSVLDQAAQSVRETAKGIYKSLGGGGEVDNNTDITLLVSGASNSDPSHFFALPPNTNSDDLTAISEGLDGDVDAVWPNKIPIKASASGIEFDS